MSDRYKGAILSPTAPTVTPQSAGGIYTSSQQLQYQGQGVWPQAVNNPLTNSLRFRSSASAYLSRTPASAGNRKTWTYSTWLKRGAVGAEGTIISGGATTGRLCVFFNSSGQLVSDIGGTGTYDQSTAVYRDPSAWYHFVWQFDTTQATAANRSRMYINGVQVTLTNTRTFTQNADYEINNSVLQTLGTFSNSIGTYNFDGYQTETNFIDGSALTPSSFGTTDAYGIWQPIPYTGAYGTNGFYLPFTDNSALTTSSNVGLGKDFSGNGNYWVTNNISITAGSTYDSMKDVPTNTNSNTANYATLNPTVPKTYCTQTDGNLKSAGTSSTDSDTSVATIGVSSGKWYWEDKIGTISSAVYPILGAGRNILSSFVGAYPGIASVGGFGIVVGNGTIVREGTTVTTVTALVANDVVGFALDLGALTCAIYKNNSLIYTVTGLTAGTYYPMANEYSNSNSTHNYGQQPFTYTPPSGFYPLNTYNLPTPTILDGDQYMDATLITGTAATQVITNSGSMQPDMVWLKSRSNANNHTLYDALRGVNNPLYPNLTNAEGSGSALLTSFNSNGFTLGANENSNDQAGETSVGWQWRASNAAGVSNTQGTITSTVSANTTAGFSIVTYTGNFVASTIGHGLGVAPSFIICKVRNSAGFDWNSYHASLGATKFINLNSTSAAGTASSVWNNTAPTSSVFSVADNGGTNGSGNTIVAYCFAPVAGYSAFGSYTGNGSADGPFIYTGFRPRFLMMKRFSAGTANWYIFDSSRSTYNAIDVGIYPNLSNAETALGASTYDFLSNGFKLRQTNADFNESGIGYIYAAFAENPFKISRAR